VKRRLFTLLAMVSLLLCVATLLLWLRSERESDDFWWWTDFHGVGIYSDGGRLSFWDATSKYKNPSVQHLVHMPPLVFLHPPTTGVYSKRLRTGFGSSDDGVHWRAVIVPHLVMVVITILLPVQRVRAYWSRRRSYCAGYCVTCGYDLRATPDRCPECGMVVTADDIGGFINGKRPRR
jgi:hypothetical protein